MSRSYKKTPMIWNGCGGWAGTWAKRHMHRTYRHAVQQGLHSTDWHVEDFIMPQLYEVCTDDIYKPQYRAWYGDIRREALRRLMRK